MTWHKIVLSSDLGLKKAGWPIEGMSAFLELLREAGVGSDDLKKMITTNPANLLNLIGGPAGLTGRQLYQVFGGPVQMCQDRTRISFNWMALKNRSESSNATHDRKTHPHWYLGSGFMGSFILPKERIQACF